MAHTKSGGSTKNGRDSKAKSLGVKIHDGQMATPGKIIIRQRGSYFVPGTGVRRGGDDTLYAIASGVVKFSTKRKVNFDNSRRITKIVAVLAPSA